MHAFEIIKTIEINLLGYFHFLLCSVYYSINYGHKALNVYVMCRYQCYSSPECQAIFLLLQHIGFLFEVQKIVFIFCGRLIALCNNMFDLSFDLLPFS